MAGWNDQYSAGFLDNGLSQAGRSVLVIADCAEGARLGSDAVRACGGRLVSCISVDQAPDRLANQISLDAVLFEAMTTEPRTVDPLIDKVGQFASRRGARSIISTSIENLDAYSGRLDDERVTLLCAPDATDRIIALHTALAEVAPRLNDSATDLESVRLRRIADEVGRIAKALSNLSETSETAQPFLSDMHIGFRAEPELFGRVETGPSAHDVRQAIRLRRLREQYFMADLFADPAWDMLLDLMAARIENIQVSVSSLCIASAVPPTTALRWIKRMTDDYLLERVADPDDGRRIFIRLSDTAADALSRYWVAANKLGASMI